MKKAWLFPLKKFFLQHFSDTKAKKQIWDIESPGKFLLTIEMKLKWI